MSISSRLTHAFTHAVTLPLTADSHYILMSDCHRGVGTSSDNFLKNQHLYFAALSHYYQKHYTYIELGDGDELWENRNMKDIIEIHNDIFWLFSLFHQKKRLYLLYGNHDMIKKQKNFSQKKCNTYFCTDCQTYQPLFHNLVFHEGIILQSASNPDTSLYLTHGHQASLLNSTFWPLAQFLVRYLWKPLETIGVSDPTSAAKNYTIKGKTEKHLNHWATNQNCILITGHTHRPVLPETPSHYYNTGSCIHPRCITCIEVNGFTLTLVKWSMVAQADGALYVRRSVLSGPVFFSDKHIFV